LSCADFFAFCFSRDLKFGIETLRVLLKLGKEIEESHHIRYTQNQTFATMHLTTFVSPFLSTILLLPLLAHSYTTAPTYASSAPSPCVTVTSTNGGACPTPTPCTMEACLLLSSVTLHCGCPSIYTERVCASTCPLGCGTTYQTLYIPCATSFSFSGSNSGVSTWSSSTPDYNNTSTRTVTSGSATSRATKTKHSETGVKTITCTSTRPGNVTTVIVTSTSITTITSCPAKVTCHGQTTTWQGSEGPFGCAEKKTCSCVLPGGGNATLTGTGTVSVGGVVTTSGGGSASVAKTGTTTSTKATSSAPTQVQANGANLFGAGLQGLVVGLLGLLVGGL
jgi:hypothetical protein